MLGTVLMCVLIGMLRQASAQLCPVCDCCKNNNCIQINCPDGCIDGYWDDDQHKDCRNPCLPRCLRCTNGSVCDACKDGYYGPTCEECTFPCKTCSGTTCLTCIDGWYGDQCINLCQSACKTCDDGSSCLTCVDGKHGNQCEHNCHETCKTCDSNGNNDCTSCPDGKWHNICNEHCGEGCKYGTCNFKDGKCECYETFTGDTCLDCIAGRYGPTCSLYCPEVCHTCDINAECLSCKSWYHDIPDCTRCHNRNCLNDICLSNGTCKTCANGYYGNSCESRCPLNCLDNTCDRVSGNCYSCKAGYFRDFCNDTCLINCISCDLVSSCSACNIGYFGQTCEICSHCDPVGSCNVDGYCQVKCADSLSGEHCNESCSENCMICDRNNKYSCSVCVDGRYGYDVTLDEFTCSNTCSNKCRNDTCHIQTGMCTYGCVKAYYGPGCDRPCPSNCLHDNCYQDNGTCVNGCNAGYSGNTCECPNNCICDNNDKCVSCKTNFYGTNCTSKCENTCVSNADDVRCSQDDGSCDFGCVNGYFGPRCSDTCKHCVNNTCDQFSGICAFGAVPPTEQTPVAAIVGPLVAIIVIFIIGILAYCIWKRNKTKLCMSNAEDKFEVTYENALEQSSGNETDTDAGHSNYDSLSNREDKTGYTTIQTASEHTVGDYYNVKQ